MNVGEMDGGAEPLAKTLRRFNCLDRHLREIDRHQDISNVQFFHGPSTNLLPAAHLSLIAKIDSFLAHLAIGSA